MVDYLDKANKDKYGVFILPITLFASPTNDSIIFTKSFTKKTLKYRVSPRK